ncbi:hypothetical protein Bca4012_078812 [Brassica carinata]
MGRGQVNDVGSGNWKKLTRSGSPTEGGSAWGSEQHHPLHIRCYSACFGSRWTFVAMASSSRRACVSVSSSPVKCVQVKGLQVSLTSMFCCSSPVHTVPPGSPWSKDSFPHCCMVVAQGLTSVLILLSSSSSEVRQGSWNSPCVPMRER